MLHSLRAFVYSGTLLKGSLLKYGHLCIKNTLLHPRNIPDTSPGLLGVHIRGFPLGIGGGGGVNKLRPCDLLVVICHYVY